MYCHEHEFTMCGLFSKQTKYLAESHNLWRIINQYNTMNNLDLEKSQKPQFYITGFKGKMLPDCYESIHYIVQMKYTLLAVEQVCLSLCTCVNLPRLKLISNAVWVYSMASEHCPSCNRSSESLLHSLSWERTLLVFTAMGRARSLWTHRYTRS